MKTNYREMLGIYSLREACGVLPADRTQHQKKAIKNIKYCANDQWGYVNSWLDERNENAREYMLDASDLFETIYYESQINVYDEGSCYFGEGSYSYLKDIRFCGKDFLQKVCFYYTAKLLEDSVYEVEGTEEEADRIYTDLMILKNKIYG